MSDRQIGEVRQDTADPARTVSLGRRLSAKLLVLTACFVLIVEVLIFVPSIANFRLGWLQERLGTAAALSVVLVEEDANTLSRQVQDDVLMAIGAKAIAVRYDGMSRLLVVTEVPPEVDEHIDLGDTSLVEAMAGALDTLVSGGNRMLRVFGKVGDSNKEFELIIPDSRLRMAMLAYSRNVALLSLLIALVTATLVFYTIDRIMIRPIRGMTRSMLDFSRRPDDPGRIIQPDRRGDEIGVAERELADMQTRLQKTLGEQKHLADLGLAVSKINHDMRNILASAQLMSDRLGAVKDPAVQALAPRLLRALDRAVSYSEGVLAYGRTQEPPPARRRLRLRQVVDEVHNLLGIEPESGVEFVNGVDPAFEIDADSEQLFRILTNLCRNAVQAMAAETESAAVNRLSVTAERLGSVSRILVTDTGPGLPKKARENLFAAFRGAARSGGTGLGLAIAQELVRAHGGALELVESRGGSTVFSVTIPDQPVRLDDARGSLRRHG
ncbi:HAMP domain-containing sensor histidine kinase [Mesorhizobium sp. LHD-90]|uniref:HAMP domain-containing sensor histidine kinase n=1 Tax=Mesorhizobium sp. LHD-90 TaxID=3071414 RepID=UPI0027DEC936|nr:HAMP domain-containing sensor histidine kinase [Mesorhizobium sp. LHD-90]MDQ6435488.1 HAMP domain-containing sensor histidine kinase [Mesorhizobium sp. LHD-90]